MITIVTVDTNSFTINGETFARIYVPSVAEVGKLAIINAYDTRQYILPQTAFYEIEIDGITYGTLAETVIALLPVIYKYLAVGGGAFLSASDIDTLSRINGIITDATLIDTTDARLSDNRDPNAHTHVEADITDLQTYLLASAYTASDVLVKLLTVDTDASGLNSSTLRGKPLAISGAWYDAVPYISGSGVLEIGKYIDFHDGDTDTGDNHVRLTAVGDEFTTADKVRFTGTGGISLAGTAHPFQVGTNAGTRMKFSVNQILCSSPSDTATTLYLQSTGAPVNIGLNATSNGVVNGSWTATSHPISSDERLKTRIKKLKTRDTSEVEYISYRNKNDKKNKRERYGVSAQKLEKIFPELVREHEDSGMKNVDYIGLLVLENMSKQKKLDEQEKRIDKLEELVNKLIKKQK